MILRTIAFTALLVTSRMDGQVPDSVDCRRVLASPVSDSILVTVGLTTRAVDPADRIGDGYRADLAAGLRQTLHLPAPLPLTVYRENTDSGSEGHQPRTSTTVVPTIFGVYAVSVLRDGHVVNARVVGGARAAAFDDAFLKALQVLSDSGLLPPRHDSFEDTLELRLTIAPMDLTKQAQPPGKEPTPPPEPLFRMRVPVLGPGTSAVPVPNNPTPHYPPEARQRGLEGYVLLQFILTPDGHADMNSIQVKEATAMEFAAAVLAAFPQFRFRPQELGGCYVATVVEMPFEFRLGR